MNYDLMISKNKLNQLTLILELTSLNEKKPPKNISKLLELIASWVN